MVTKHLVPLDIQESYEVHEWRNAAGVLASAYPSEWNDILSVLRNFEFKRSEILTGGGSKSPIAKRIDMFLAERGWQEKNFKTSIRVDENERASPTHKVDCFKGRVGLEIEWNNKDPFFDRDLNNFRLLFELGVLDVGVIITRSSNLQNEFARLGRKVAAKYGASTTHMDKLVPRLEGGGGGGCPVLAFGITKRKYIEDSLPIVGEDGADVDDSE